MADMIPGGLPAEVRDEALARLRRAEGQLRGVQKMLQEERGCQDILIQLAAVKAAVVQTAMTMLGSQLANCVQPQGPNEQPAGKEALSQFMEVFKKFS